MFQIRTRGIYVEFFCLISPRSVDNYENVIEIILNTYKRDNNA